MNFLFDKKVKKDNQKVNYMRTLVKMAGPFEIDGKKF